VDWMEGFDFILNTLCAASLSGMVGSQSSLDFVEEGLEQIGTLLEKHTETSIQAENAMAIEAENAIARTETSIQAEKVARTIQL